MSEPASLSAAVSGPRTLVGAAALLAVLALVLAVWTAFLVPLRVGAVPVPVAHVVAGAGNLALGLAGGRLLGRHGAALPGVVWLAVALTLASRRAEGDLVVPGTAMGVAYLAVGSLTAAAAYGMSSADARRRFT